MLINQTNNNDDQVPELAKIFKDVHLIQIRICGYTLRMKRHMYVYHSIPIMFVKL